MINIEAEAERRLQQFVQTIHNLVISKEVPIDLLVCGGNTGLVMAYITERIYTFAGVRSPARLALPIYRYYPGFLDDPQHLFDNSALHDEVESTLADFPGLQNVLFVDDEIGVGITALTILKFLQDWQEAHHPRKGFNYYIVAEDQGFKANRNIHFIPYANEIEGWNNVIARMVPAEYGKPIAQVFPEEALPFHQRMNILLGLPIKEFANGQPRFGSNFLAKAEEMLPNLCELQQDFRRLLDEKISNYLDFLANGRED